MKNCNVQEERHERRVFLALSKYLLDSRKAAGKLTLKPVTLKTRTRKHNIQTAYAIVYGKDKAPIVIAKGKEDDYLVKGLE